MDSNQSLFQDMVQNKDRASLVREALKVCYSFYFLQKQNLFVY